MIKNKKGFTLIELLIVIAIIAILAAGLIVGLNPARHFRQARNSTRWNHVNAIATAIYSYAVENEGNFPPGCIGEAGSPEPITAATYEEPAEGDWCYGEVVPEYLRVIPKDPSSEEHYQVEFIDGDETGIKITSTADEASEIVLMQ